jgi:hypothetical protein
MNNMGKKPASALLGRMARGGVAAGKVAAKSMPAQASKGLAMATSKVAGTPAAAKIPAFKKGGKVAAKGNLPPWLAKKGK